MFLAGRTKVSDRGRDSRRRYRRGATRTSDPGSLGASRRCAPPRWPRRRGAGALSPPGAGHGGSQLGVLLLLRLFGASAGPTELADEDVDGVRDRVKRVVTR